MYYDCYDRIHANYGYSADVNYVIIYLQSNNLTFGNMLEIGCGTGKHTVLLANHFSHVYAIDQDAEMIKKASHLITQENISNISLMTITAQDLNRCELPSMSCACAFFNVVNYMLDLPALGQFFQSIATAITPTGIFFFDCLDDQKQYESVQSFVSAYGQGPEAFTRKSTCIYERPTRLLNVKESYERANSYHEYQHTYKLWNRDELSKTAQAQGFQVLMCQPKTDVVHHQKNQLLFIMKRRAS